MTRVDAKKFRGSPPIPIRLAGGNISCVVLLSTMLTIAAAPADEHDTSTAAPMVDQTTTPETGSKADDTVDEAARAGAYARLVRLTEEERFDEALAAAFQVLRITQDIYGVEAVEVAQPLADIAVLQQQLNQPDEAETNLTTAIVIVEDVEGPLSPRLVEPLRLLGRLYNATGRSSQALQTFKRSLRVNQVNKGFTDFSQFPIMDGLTNSYAKLGEFEDAAFYQETQLEIHQRKFGVSSPETAPGYHKLARWYRRNFMLEEARLLYQRADRLVRKAYGSDSPERAKGLRGLARVYLEGGNGSLAANTLRKTMELGDEDNIDDRILQANAQIALGDVYQRMGKNDTATEQYVTAWNKLSQSEATQDELNAAFDEPVWLVGSRLMPRFASRSDRNSADRLQTGFVLIGYSVTETGRVTDATVIESEPAGLMDKTYLSIYRRSKYRPRFVDGSAVATQSLVRRHEFQYTPEREKETERKKSSPVSRGRLENPND